MPPEPLPWDRKDFFKERKHDRSSESVGGSSLSRWREMPHHGSSRWGYADFRRPHGHGKQGSWNLFPEEPGHGFAQSRPNNKILDDDGFRPTGYRGEFKYGRSSRESRGSFGQKDWRNHSWEAHAPLNGSGRSSDVNIQKSVDMLAFNSHPPQSDFVSTWDRFQFKDQHDKNGVANGLSTCQRSERENSLSSIDWKKPLKWTRSGSLSSRSSGFSHSSSSKSIGVDSTEMKAEVQQTNVTPMQSPSRDATPCMASTALSDETCSRKKPRLGWGEGLAKYEKKKVEGPEDGASKNDMLVNMEALHSQSSNLADKSPQFTGFFDCGSPTTPSSVGCSSSSGLEDKSIVKVSNADNDINYLSGSPGVVSQNHSVELDFNLENLELPQIANMSSSLNDLLQTDYPIPVDSGFVRSTAMSKLLIWKGVILKALEMTESEIDSLDNELKSLISEPECDITCPALSGSLAVGDLIKTCGEIGAASNVIPRCESLQPVSSGDVIVEKTYGSQVEPHTEVKDDDVEGQSTAMSELTERPSLGKYITLSDPEQQGDGLQDFNIIRFGNMDNNGSIYGHNTEKMDDVSACEDGLQLVASSICAPVSTDITSNCNRTDMLYNLIAASNKESVHQASEVFNKLLPSNECSIDISRIISTSCCQTDAFVEEKFARRKRFLKFKERLVTLKFRAFQHLWKEDMRLLSMRKHRAKSQKRIEQSMRILNGSYHKHRSSNRARASSTAGNLSLVPTTEIINIVSKLLSNSEVKHYRTTLKMPALILDKQEKAISRFISCNGLVEDPCAIERERFIINPWTPEEEGIFIEKLSILGKDFSKIASFLDHKTTADCVEFYYKNHKSDSFKRAKKDPEQTKQEKSYSANIYLVTSGKRWNREANAASLDMLGAASAIAANVDDVITNRQKCTSKVFGGASSDCKARSDNTVLERSCSLDVSGNDRETMAADVLAGICGSLSSEGVSSCITSSVDPGEGYPEWKHAKVGSSRRRPLTPEVTQGVDDETCSDESCGEMDPTDWTDEERSMFIQAISSYGKDFAKISRCVRTRTRDQCKVFFSKARKCLGLDMIHGRDNGVLVNDDANGGGSDNDDACIVETGSVICSNKSGSKIDEDLQTSDMNVSRDEADPAGASSLQPELDGPVEHHTTIPDCEVSVLMPENLEAQGKLEVVFDGDSNCKDCSSGQSLLRDVNENLIAPSGSGAGQGEPVGLGKLEKLILGEETVDNGLAAKFFRELQMKSAEEICAAEQSGKELGGGNLTLHDSGLNSGSAENNVGFGSLSGDQEDSHPVRQPALNASLPIPDSVSSSGFTTDSGYQLKAALEPDPARKLLVVSFSEENCFVAPNSTCDDPIATKSHGIFNLHASSTHVQVISDQKHKSIGAYDFHKLSSGCSLVEHFDTSQGLRGHSVQLSTNGMNVDISCKKPSVLQGIPKSDNLHSNHILVQDSCLKRCNSSGNNHVSGLLLLPQEQTRERARPASEGALDSGKGCRNGNVKLFGQILTHPSPQQKPTSSVPENELSDAQHPKLRGRSCDLQHNVNHYVEGAEAPTKFNCANYLGLENLPLRSPGFWDGNRMHTGFPSLPDSAILLAKYPAAFGYYPATSSRLEEQPLSTIVKSHDCATNGVTAFSAREANSSSSGVGDFQLYRSRDGARVRPFTLEVNKRPDVLLPEMQRRDGLESVSSMQQPGRGGIVGINVVGRGGGLCMGVSDPVAAIRMHYAKAEQCSAQAGSSSGSIIEE